MRVPYPAEQELNVFSTSSKAAFTLVVAALVVACIRSCKLLDRRDVGGEEERYFVGETVPLIRAAALGFVLDLIGEEREENRLLEGLELSALERTEERPGTVLMGEEEEEAAPEPTMTALYGRVEQYMFREDLGDAGGVMEMDDLSIILTPPPVVMGEVLADMAARPLTDTGSGTLLPGEYMTVELTGTGYWACWTTVLMGDEMVL